MSIVAIKLDAGVSALTTLTHPEGPMEKYLTTEEVAEIARTSPSTVRYWRMAGTGPKGVRRGRRVLYPESVVEQWMSADDDQAVRAAS